MTSLLEEVGKLLPIDSGSFGSVHVGIDLEDIDEWRTLLTTEPGVALLQSRFTDMEREYIGADADRVAGRWAIKEAVSKAVGTGFRGLRPADIEISRDAGGQPTVSPRNIGWPLGSHAWGWSVSLSRSENVAIAIAIGIPQMERLEVRNASG